MSAVSANTLFHFTDKDALIGILKSGAFWPKYSLEHFERILPASSIYKTAYIPHVCFCDLTITQLSGSRHTKDFGRFGIGLRKEWGIKNGISPVVYVHQRSLPSNHIHQLVGELTKVKDEFPEERFPQQIRSKLLELFKYIKPYSGIYQKGKKLDKEIIYYHEREWRYCPSANDKVYNVLSGRKPENRAAVQRMNRAFQNNNKLTFQPLDIKYIILDCAEDINTVVQVINKLKLSETAKNELKTKIITFTEIDNDY